MAGRLVHFLVAGAAIFRGMVIQGDIDLESELGDHEAARPASQVDRRVDRRVDRIVDRATRKMVVRGEDGQTVEPDAATKRALAAAVAELIRAEGRLVTAKLDDETPATAIEQAEQRRDLARETVERIADDARAETRGNRDALRQNIRDEVREGARDAVRS